MGVFLLGLWPFGRGQLPALETAIRDRSFGWPTAEVVVGLVVFGFWWWPDGEPAALNRDGRPCWAIRAGAPPWCC